MGEPIRSLRRMRCWCCCHSGGKRESPSRSLRRMRCCCCCHSGGKRQSPSGPCAACAAVAAVTVEGSGRAHQVPAPHALLLLLSQWREAGEPIRSLRRMRCCCCCHSGGKRESPSGPCAACAAVAAVTVEGSGRAHQVPAPHALLLLLSQWREAGEPIRSLRRMRCCCCCHSGGKRQSPSGPCAACAAVAAVTVEGSGRAHQVPAPHALLLLLSQWREAAEPIRSLRRMRCCCCCHSGGKRESPSGPCAACAAVAAVTVEGSGRAHQVPAPHALLLLLSQWREAGEPIRSLRRMRCCCCCHSGGKRRRLRQCHRGALSHVNVSCMFVRCFLAGKRNGCSGRTHAIAIKHRRRRGDTIRTTGARRLSGEEMETIDHLFASSSSSGSDTDCGQCDSADEEEDCAQLLKTQTVVWSSAEDAEADTDNDEVHGERSASFPPAFSEVSSDSFFSSSSCLGVHSRRGVNVYCNRKAYKKGSAGYRPRRAQVSSAVLSPPSSSSSIDASPLSWSSPLSASCSSPLSACSSSSPLLLASSQKRKEREEKFNKSERAVDEETDTHKKRLLSLPPLKMEEEGGDMDSALPWKRRKPKRGYELERETRVVDDGGDVVYRTPAPVALEPFSEEAIRQRELRRLDPQTAIVYDEYTSFMRSLGYVWRG